MTRRGILIASIGLVLAGGLGLAGVFGGTGSLRSYLRRTYPTAASQEGGRSLVFTSPEPPTATAQKIASRWSPADRINDPSGIFLRYRDDIVVVSSDGAGGSLINVDDDRTGYARWYPYVGGYWGTFSGRGETFRGGGPGAGK